MPKIKKDTGFSATQTILNLGSNSEQLTTPWSFTSTSAANINTPDELPSNHDWQPAFVPGTVASALSLADNIDNIDKLDWWYRCKFKIPSKERNQHNWHLQFDGLATLADVWLNGQLILSSQNMFTGHTIDISATLDASNPNQLIIVFRSVQQALSQKRPRPRWKTNLIDNQQLRWFRTSLLGRIPGWANTMPAIGPWQPIRLIQTDQLSLDRFQLNTSLSNQQGQVTLNAALSMHNSHIIDEAILRIDGKDYALNISQDKNNTVLQGHLAIDNTPLWWPHTHGKPTLLDYQLLLVSDNQTTCLKQGKIGFRSIELINDETVAFIVNGQKIFCRGACWTVNDIKSLSGDTTQLKKSLLLAKNAGLNMLRIGGTMIYESDDFYALCDELGIMIWQDFMFANMDYPIDDPDFANNVKTEIDYQLQRLHSHACISAYCGNSEVEQQASMFGMTESIWKNSLFYQILPDACQQWHGKIAYIPSSPNKGALPFHIGTGISHYFAIGAYKRSIDDPSRDKVKFTTECLAFSNIPCEQTLQEIFASSAPAIHQPNWKAGVPRDNTAGWDFEDIRDYYLETLFKLNSTELRYTDNARYITLSQMISGEVMQSAYHHWRGGHGQCNGALIWFFKDLIPGAGWGVIDSLNRPKPVYYYLKRSWATQIITLNDEQLDGLSITAINEANKSLDATIELRMLKNSKIEIAKAQQDIAVDPFSSITISVDHMLGSFHDTNYSYRFGPPKHDIVIASLKDIHGKILSETFYFPNGLSLNPHAEVNIETNITKNGEHLLLNIESDRFLQSVQLEVRGYSAHDNYFHLQPGYKKIIPLIKDLDSGQNSGKRFKASLKAVNFPDTVRIQL